jgi:hypothetical protein
MPILKRDGTPYKLSGPNPLMKNQSGWSRTGKYVCHNCHWQPEVFPDPNIEYVPRAKYAPPPIRQGKIPEADFFEELNAKPEVVATPDKQPDKQSDEDIDFAFLRDNLIVVHCLPAHYREHRDELYGQRYKSVRYGNKYTFEAIIIEQGDLQILLWTTKELTEGSILYPQNMDKRWWKVEKISSKAQDGGFLIRANLSEYQPDFS